MYDELNNPNRDTTGKLAKGAADYTPVHRGYLVEKAATEYFAENLRGYLMDPGWYKSVAPEMAEILRKLVREKFHYFRLNSLAPILAGGAAAGAAGALSRQTEEENERGTF